MAVAVAAVAVVTAAGDGDSGCCSEASGRLAIWWRSSFSSSVDDGF